MGGTRTSSQRTRERQRIRAIVRLNSARLPFKATLDHLATCFPGGRPAFMEIMRFGCEIEPGLKPIVQAWDDLTVYRRNRDSIDRLAEANASLDVAKIAGIVAEAAIKYGLNLSKLPSNTA